MLEKSTLDGFTEEQISTLYNIIHSLLGNDINLENIDMYSDVEDAITLTALINSRLKINFDIISSGDAIGYTYYLDGKSIHTIEYLNKDNDYDNFFKKFLKENKDAAKRSGS